MSRTARRWLLAACLVLLVPAAPAADDSAERLRIARERVAAQQRFNAAERGCAERFAVTDCLDAARRERRESLLRLRREESLLDEARRKQRAAERMETIRRRISDEEQGRSATPKAAREPNTPSAPRIRAREREPAASEAASPLHRGRVTVREKSSTSSAAERAAQENRSRAAYDARQQAAQDHEADNRRRNEERARDHKPAAPLPAPSGAAP